MSKYIAKNTHENTSINTVKIKILNFCFNKGKALDHLIKFDIFPPQLRRTEKTIQKGIRLFILIYIYPHSFGDV